MTDLPPLLAMVDRQRLADRFGPSVGAWCDELPDLVGALADTWHLRVRGLMTGGANSVLLSCTSHDHGRVVLKLTPDPQIAAQEAGALSAWASCRHIVGLRRTDLARSALLLEAIEPGGTLAADPTGWSLTEIAPMLDEVWHAPSPDPGLDFPLMSERVDLVFELARRRLQRWPEVAARFEPGAVARSHQRARDLAATGPVRLVHGDLHPGNVLRAGRGRGVVAIDPRPCWGDPATDAVDWMLSEVVDEASLRHRIDWLADTVDGVDRARVWTWCRAFSVIVAASLLARRHDDPVGDFLLQFAQGAD